MDLNVSFGHYSSSDDDLQFLTIFMAPADIVPERPTYFVEMEEEVDPEPSKTEKPPRRGRGPGKKNKKKKEGEEVVKPPKKQKGRGPAKKNKKKKDEEVVEPPKKQRKTRQKKRVDPDTPQTPEKMIIEMVEVPERSPSPPPTLPAPSLPAPTLAAPEKPEVVLKHKCRFCPRRCAQPAQLIRHETIHMRGNDQPLHICPYCEAPYAFPMTLNYHIRLDHPGKAKYDY